MEKHDEDRRDELIEMGQASVETKGGDDIGVDTQGLRKKAGISDS
jgi:hypothetical protein